MRSTRAPKTAEAVAQGRASKPAPMFDKNSALPLTLYTLPMAAMTSTTHSHRCVDAVSYSSTLPCAARW